MECAMCRLRHKVDGLRADTHAQHVELRSVLIAEEKDRTVARIYKPLTTDQRVRLLSLLREIDNSDGGASRNDS